MKQDSQQAGTALSKIPAHVQSDSSEGLNIRRSFDSLLAVSLPIWHCILSLF